MRALAKSVCAARIKVSGLVRSMDLSHLLFFCMYLFVNIQHERVEMNLKEIDTKVIEEEKKIGHTQYHQIISVYVIKYK